MRNLFIGFALLLLIGVISATTTIEAPAVDAEGKGILSQISATATSGSGDIFVSITPLTGIDTQHSEKTAVDLAANLLKLDQSKYNFLFKIDSTAEVVDGPSAGAALTLLSYSELSKKSMRRDLTLTGSIDKDGKVGKIGGVFEKARAVAESKLRNYKIFLIPRGQRIQNGVDIAKYAKEKWNLQVVEVDTIKDVVDYAFNTQEGSTVQVKEQVIIPLNLMPFQPSDQTKEFKEISTNEIAETQKRLKATDSIEDIKAQVEQMINTSQDLIDKNYYYSGANNAFLATITLDEITMANSSKAEIRQRIKELKALADNMKFAPQTEGNFEWIIGAKMRYHWAKDKIISAEDKFAIGDLLSAAGDISVSSSWLRAATRMNAIAQTKSSGNEL